MENRIYTLSEILRDSPDYSQKVWNKLYEKFSANPHGFCFPILVQSSDITHSELHLYTLIEISMLDSYTQVIPENGVHYACDLKKTESLQLKNIVEIDGPSKNIQVEINLYKTSFIKSNIRKINFPDDYFLKGIPLFTELLSKQLIFEDSHSGNRTFSKNQNYSLIKQLTLNRIIGN